MSLQLDEVDHRLITALQTAPRAPWGPIGQAAGVDATTAARRWARLQDAGEAWFSCYPAALRGDSAQVAVIEVVCAAGRALRVAEAVAPDPHVLTVEHTTGARDLVLEAVFRDLAGLGEYTQRRLGALPGVTAVRAHPVTSLQAEGSRWRLDRLGDPARLGAQSRLQDLGPRRHGVIGAGAGSGDGVAEEDLPLVRALHLDCRAPVADLAERTGHTPATVRRRLARLDAAGALIYRCDVSARLTGWPIAATLWASGPAGPVAEAAARLAGLRETRVVAMLAGPANLLTSMRLRSLDDLPGWERRVAEAAPEVAVVDRMAVLQLVKMGGHLLDADGRHVRAVPLDLWPLSR